MRQKLGFTYFSSPNYLVNQHLKTWMPALEQLGASFVIFQAGFDHAIPEDVFIRAKEHSLTPIVHFTSELPLARNLNQVSFLLDVYARWGVENIILGNRPNSKDAWPTAGWHYENLVDHFLDRFIPLANHVVRIGLKPVLSPLQPGGDYWDTAFVELVMEGLKRRRLDEILDKLILASYGYTFDKPLSWGMGGPERWSVSKPYMTPEGQEDQLGFNNYEWVQAFGQRATGREMPVIILDAGHPGTKFSQPDPNSVIETIQRITLLCSGKQNYEPTSEKDRPTLKDDVLGCTFALDTLEWAIQGDLSFEVLQQIFVAPGDKADKSTSAEQAHKCIDHYLLLPLHSSGIPDVVLNKVRPLIKKLHPTVGFSLEEASFARRVSVYPDSSLFPTEKINQLRTAGCVVDVLPESGIEIATSL